MIQAAERSAVNDSAVSQALIAIACAELKLPEMAQLGLDKISEFGPIARHPEAYFRRHGATEEIVESTKSRLEKARDIVSSK